MVLDQLSDPTIKIVEVQFNITSTISWTTYKLGLFFWMSTEKKIQYEGLIEWITPFGLKVRQ